MNKKLLMIMLVFMFVLTGCGKKNVEVIECPVDPLEEIRQEIINANKIVGVGFLGYNDYSDGLELREYVKNYVYYDNPFIYDIDSDHYVSSEGYGLYVIVPASDDASTSINDLINDKVLYRSEQGKPIIFSGILTENYPEIEVNVVLGDEVVSFPLGVFEDNHLAKWDAYLDISDPAVVERNTVDEQFLDGTFLAKYQNDDGLDVESYLKIEYPTGEFELETIIEGETSSEHGWFYRYNMDPSPLHYNRDAFVFEFSDGNKSGIYWCYNLPGQEDRFYLLRLCGDLFVRELYMDELLFIKK